MQGYRSAALVYDGYVTFDCYSAVFVNVTAVAAEAIAAVVVDFRKSHGKSERSGLAFRILDGKTERFFLIGRRICDRIPCPG